MLIGGSDAACAPGTTFGQVMRSSSPPTATSPAFSRGGRASSPRPVKPARSVIKPQNRGSAQRRGSPATTTTSRAASTARRSSSRRRLRSATSRDVSRLPPCAARDDAHAGQGGPLRQGAGAPWRDAPPRCSPLTRANAVGRRPPRAVTPIVPRRRPPFAREAQPARRQLHGPAKRLGDAAARHHDCRAWVTTIPQHASPTTPRARGARKAARRGYPTMARLAGSTSGVHIFPNADSHGTFRPAPFESDVPHAAVLVGSTSAEVIHAQR